MAKKNPPLNIYRKIAVSFIGLTVVLVLVVLYISFTEAKITIRPVKQVESAEFIVAVAEDPKSDNVIPGEIMETEVSGSETFTATSTRTEEGRAEGEITIYNNYSKDQPLIATTRFLTPNGLLFRLKETVLVPAGGQVQAEIHADEEGTEYEIGPTRFTIPGLWSGLQDKIYAESHEPIKGGVREIRVVQENDIENAREELKNKLLEQGKEELLKKLGEGRSLPEETIFSEIIESTIDAIPGEEVDEFTIDMNMRVIGISVDTDKLLALSETKLRSSLPEDRRLINIIPGSLKYSLESYNSEEQSAVLSIYLDGISSLQKNSLILNKSRLVGMNAEEAEAYLESFEDIEDAVVQFSPFWIRKIPSLKDHIKIEVE